jgi:membrane peptidoglycan carboxypeptidase
MTLPVSSFDDCDGPIRGTTQWNVGNYSTRLSGLFDLRTGTEQSVNTFFAQLLQQTGVCDPARIATAAGYLATWQPALSAARHADPRSTEQCDHSRGNLDRHGVHSLTVYVAGVRLPNHSQRSTARFRVLVALSRDIENCPGTF